MKRMFIGWFLSIMAAAQAYSANEPAVQEVLKLKQAGMTEEVVISFIKGRSVNYALSADDLIKLRDQGLSNAILTAMIESSDPSSPSVVSASQNVPLNLGGGVLSPGNETSAIPNAPLAPLAPVIAETPQPAAATVLTQPVVVNQPVVVTQPVYFYRELSPYGSWILVDNEWCWQPTMVVVNAGWRPYWDGGNWIYTDAGWCWSSDYSWGSIAFHYGRWNMHPRRGWVWYPGNDWAPAWVTWRHGGDYCGWAPLPPRSHFDRGTGHYFYNGHRVEESFSFGLSFNHFSFSYTRELGERNRHAFRDEREVRNIYNRTTVINNYTVVKGSRGHEERLVNRGIEPRAGAERGGRPVEQMRLNERTTDAHAPARIDTREKTVSLYRPPVSETRMNASGQPVARPVSARTVESGRPARTEAVAPKRQEQRVAPPATLSQPTGRMNERQSNPPAMAPSSRSGNAPAVSASPRSPGNAPSAPARQRNLAPSQAPVPAAPAAAIPGSRSGVSAPKQMEQRSVPLSPRMQPSAAGARSPSNPGIGQRNNSSRGVRERQ
jgi:hypothetical protein